MALTKHIDKNGQIKIRLKRFFSLSLSAYGLNMRRTLFIVYKLSRCWKKMRQQKNGNSNQIENRIYDKRRISQEKVLRCSFFFFVSFLNPSFFRIFFFYGIPKRRLRLLRLWKRPDMANVAVALINFSQNMIRKKWAELWQPNESKGKIMKIPAHNKRS